MTPTTPSVGERLARSTLELCGIPSETGHERRIADHVEALCRAALPAAELRRDRHSIVCAPPPADPGVPTVALVGHLDTVKCAEGQPLEIRDGRVYGCGASDMKAGVAVMLALMERVERMAVRPIFVYYDREEGPNEENGLGPLLDRGWLESPDFAVVLEPTDGEVQLGCMGLLHATVTVAGRRAHSARPWQGENALYGAVELLERLRSFGRREVRVGGLTFYEVLNPTQAWTDNSRNVVPDAVRFNVNYRFAPGRTLQEAEEEMRAWIGDEYAVEIVDHGHAGDVFADHPLLLRWGALRSLDLAPKQAWTDVARLTRNGIPAANYGPGDPAQAHQAGEWCRIDRLEECYLSLEEILADGEWETGA